MTLLLEKLRRELKALANKQVKLSGERFFKEEIKLYGIKTYLVSNIAKKYFLEIKDYEKNKVWKLCDELWKSGYMEESFIACHWLYALRKKYTHDDFKIFSNWLKKYVSNWASCDVFCNHTIGTFIEMYPSYIKELYKWTKSENRWLKRAAAVSLIVPAKKGLFLKDIFKIADLLLLDKDDMVQKGYGWMLKVASQIHQKEVYQYVLKHKKIMPRTALRYAIEKMPIELKKEAMTK